VIADRYRVIEPLGPPSAPSAGDLSYRAERLDGGAPCLLWHLEAPGGAEADLVGRLQARALKTRRLSTSTPMVAEIGECLALGDGSVVVVMPLPAGPTLAEALARDGSFSVERALRTAAKVAEALEIAHDLGLFHGGLGPQNVVALDSTGEDVQLLRFSMDWVWLAPRPGALAQGEPRPGLAPEQIAGAEPHRRSDVYGLGALLYTMLAGTAPRSRGTRRPPMLSEVRTDVSPALDRIVARALDPRPERRQRDMTDLFNDLWAELDPGWRGRSRRRGRGDGGLRWRRWVDLTARVAMAGMILTVGAFLARSFLFARPGDVWTQSPPARAGSAIAERAPGKAAAPDPGHGAEPGRSAPSVAPEAPVVSLAPAESTAPDASRDAGGGREAQDGAARAAAPTAVSARRDETPPPPSPARRARIAVAGEQRRITREPAAAPTRPRPAVAAPTRGPVVSGEPARPPSRDTEDDPGAIIDYVLKRGNQRD
jgi:hypothetical protein